MIVIAMIITIDDDAEPGGGGVTAMSPCRPIAGHEQQLMMVMNSNDINTIINK